MCTALLDKTLPSVLVYMQNHGAPTHFLREEYCNKQRGIVASFLSILITPASICAYICINRLMLNSNITNSPMKVSMCRSRYKSDSPVIKLHICSGSRPLYIAVKIISIRWKKQTNIGLQTQTFFLFRRACKLIIFFKIVVYSEYQGVELKYL